MTYAVFYGLIGFMYPFKFIGFAQFYVKETGQGCHAMRQRMKRNYNLPE